MAEHSDIDRPLPRAENKLKAEAPPLPPSTLTPEEIYGHGTCVYHPALWAARVFHSEPYRKPQKRKKRMPV